MRHQPWSAMPRTDDVDHVKIVLHDQPIEVDVQEIEPGGGSPMAQQAGLDVLQRQRLLEQRIVAEIDLPDRQIVRGMPVAVHLGQKLGRQGVGHAYLQRIAAKLVQSDSTPALLMLGVCW